MSKATRLGLRVGGIGLGMWGGNPVNGIDPNGLAPVEHYLREWVFGSQNWDEAFGKARKQKMGPFDPNDNHNRTAAEHYIFGQALGNGQMGPAMQGIYIGLGGYSATVWQDIKIVGLSPKSSPPSMIQAYWESTAYTDFIGIANYFSGNPGQCDCGNNGGK